jgi:hypothetical protein
MTFGLSTISSVSFVKSIVATSAINLCQIAFVILPFIMVRTFSTPLTLTDLVVYPIFVSSRATLNSLKDKVDVHE